VVNRVITFKLESEYAQLLDEVVAGLRKIVGEDYSRSDFIREGLIRNLIYHQEKIERSDN